MVSKKSVIVSAVLIASVCLALSCPSLGLAQTVTATIENGSLGYGLGVRGSTFSFACSAGSQTPGVACVDDGDCTDGTCEPAGNPYYPESNRIEINLNNPDNDLVYLFTSICTDDLGSNLFYSGYEVTSRGEHFPYTIVENGTCIDITFDSPPLTISQGTGTLAILYFDVAMSAVDKDCADLFLSTAAVRDGIPGFVNSNDTGQFCYYNCGVNQHCDDGIFCNGEEFCNNTWCLPSINLCGDLLCDDESDRCYCDAAWQCDDDLYCTGTETCNMGTGNCEEDLTPPCIDDGDPCTDDCDEIGDTCTNDCTAAGPWDSCCDALPCSGESVCSEEVTLSIENVPSFTGDVEVSLANSVGVSLISVQVCDVDDYLVAAACTPTSRATGYQCTCVEQALGANAGCTACGLLDPGGTLPPIGPGTGAVFTITYDLSPGSPSGFCRDLFVDTETIPPDVRDGANQPLLTLPVDGGYCIPCTTTPDCDDGNVCHSGVCDAGTCVYTNVSGPCSDGDDCTDDTCSDGTCLGADKCPDNEDYCDGVEYCSGGSCESTNLPYDDPCGTLTCNMDNTCGDDEVRLVIANASALPGESGIIEITLINGSAQVSELHFKVCDADQRSWLTITPDCTTTSRTDLFTCQFNGLCGLHGNPCSPPTQIDDCTMVCENDPGRGCQTDADCKECDNEPPGHACQVDGDCKKCAISGVACSTDIDCAGGECSWNQDPCYVHEDCPDYPSEICNGGNGRCEGSCEIAGTCDSCTNFDLGNGCVGVDIASPVPLDIIGTGIGAIAQISFSVDPVTLPPENNCADLTLRDNGAEDGSDPPLPLEVTPRAARLCVGDFCQGNFDGDNDVDALDVSTFLEDFGRGAYFNPCRDADPCNGDFSCDGDVDALDVSTFLEDFGRGTYFNPCPLSQFGACVY